MEGPDIGNSCPCREVEAESECQCFLGQKRPVRDSPASQARGENHIHRTGIRRRSIEKKM